MRDIQSFFCPAVRNRLNNVFKPVLFPKHVVVKIFDLVTNINHTWNMFATHTLYRPFAFPEQQHNFSKRHRLRSDLFSVSARILCLLIMVNQPTCSHCRKSGQSFIHPPVNFIPKAQPEWTRPEIKTRINFLFVSFERLDLLFNMLMLMF